MPLPAILYRDYIFFGLIAPVRPRHSPVRLDPFAPVEVRNRSGTCDDLASGVRIQSEFGESRLEKIATVIIHHHRPMFRLWLTKPPSGIGGFSGRCAMVNGEGRAGRDCRVALWGRNAD